LPPYIDEIKIIKVILPAVQYSSLDRPKILPTLVYQITA